MYINEIIVNSISLDLSPERDLDFTAQVNTIASVDSRQASYTPSYSVPKTAKNIRALAGLGLTSDTSLIPYQKPSCELKIEGFSFIVKGWLNVKDTSDSFKIYIYSGIINFFKAIENKNLGDMDISELDHIKNLSSVVASFTNPNYKYLITDYNGLTHYGADDEIINIDFLVPSVSVLYLWNKIFNTYGFVYEGSTFELEDFTNLWLTYPKSIAIDQTETLVDSTGSRYIDYYSSPGGDSRYYYRAIYIDAIIGNRFTATESGDYKIRLRAVNSSAVKYTNVTYYASVNQTDIALRDRVNVTTLGTMSVESSDVIMEKIIPLQAGDIVEIYDYLLMNGFLRWSSQWELKVERIIPGEGDFTEELKGFTISDFCKEIFNRFALTPYTDEFSNVIKFKSLRERLVTAPVIDWSDRFVERTSESYVYSSYAVKNTFKYQYNDKEADFSDGSIFIKNVNLQDEKTVFKSKTYSPERDYVAFNFGAVTKILKVFKIYNKELKENNGETVINYKGLDKRYHFIKKVDFAAAATVAVGSKTYLESTTVSYLPVGSFDGQDFTTIIRKYYPDLGKILNESRLHEIDLYLRDVDLLTLDLSALYYFKQEQQFYMLDKLKFKGGKISSGDFVRVKPDTVSDYIDPENPEIETEISIVWDDGTVAPKLGTATSIKVKLKSLSYPTDDEITTLEWQRYHEGAWTSLGTGVSPYLAPVATGQQKYRIMGISESSAIFYSNELEYKFVECYVYYASMEAGSGDGFTCFYDDCNGVEQYQTVNQQGGMGYINMTFCAILGSVRTDPRVNLTTTGTCY